MTPSLELRVPISPTPQNMAMLRLLLESLQRNGGPIARAAHCVASVGANEDARDLHRDYPWTKDFSLEFRWVNRGDFEEWEYHATGYDRFFPTSDADVVAMIDADLLVAGSFDAVVLEAYETGSMVGLMAHVSPFAFPGQATTDSIAWWNQIYTEAGLTTPDLDWEYSFWSLDWSRVYPRLNIRSDRTHRFGPPYFNYGVIVGRRELFDRMASTFIEDLNTASRILDRPYKSQVANCIGFARHAIPCALLPVTANFPMNLCRPGAVSTEEMMASYVGASAAENVSIYHYIGERRNFASREAVNALLAREDLEGAWKRFQALLGETMAPLEEMHW